MLTANLEATRFSRGLVLPAAKKKYLGSETEVNTPCWDALSSAWERDIQHKGL